MANGFTDEQTTLIQHVAISVADRVADRVAEEVKKHFDLKIQLHIAECITTKRVEELANQAKGGWTTLTVLAAIVLALLSSGLAILAILK